jgi:hypothetical protein
MKTLGKEVLDLISLWRTADVDQIEEKRVTPAQRFSRSALGWAKIRRHLLTLFESDDQLVGIAPLAMTVAQGAEFGPSLCVYTVVTRDAGLPSAATAVQQMFEQIDRTKMRGTLVALLLTLDDEHDSDGARVAARHAALRDALRRRVLPDCDVVLELAAVRCTHRSMPFAVADLDRPLARRLALLTSAAAVIDARHAGSLVHSSASLALATFEDVRVRQLAAASSNTNDNDDNSASADKKSKKSTNPTTASSSSSSSLLPDNGPIQLDSIPARHSSCVVDLPLAIYASFDSLAAHASAMTAIGNTLSFLGMVPFALRRQPSHPPFRLTALCRIALGANASYVLDERQQATRGAQLDAALFSEPRALAARLSAAFTPLVALGVVMRARQPLAVLVDAFGRTLVTVLAPRDAVLVSSVARYRVHAGERELLTVAW